MKKIKFLIGAFVIFALIVMNDFQSVQAYTTLDNLTILEPSVFNDLEVNFTSLPTITVSGYSDYTITDYTDTANRRKIIFNNVTSGSTLGATVTALFENCATLNGQSVDIKYVYSNIVALTPSDVNYCDLAWSSFGTSQVTGNEWNYDYIESLNIDIYFYYHGSSTPISIDTGYASIFSMDLDESAKSSNSSNVYLTQNTNIQYYSSYPSDYTNKTYSGVYKAVTDGDTSSGSHTENANACTAFQYKNVDHLNVQLLMLGTRWGSYGVGYHITFTPLTACCPDDPVKTVNKTEAYVGDTITYTVTQQVPKSDNSAFYLTSLVFNDVLDSNLTYKSLKVYDENGNDVTSSAGTTTHTSSSNTLKYTFDADYLEWTMNYDGEDYTFVITATVNSSPTSTTITNTAKTNFSNQYNLTSNTVTTNLKAKVITKYLDYYSGEEIATSTTKEYLSGKSYTTDKKTITDYTFYKDSGNTSGTVGTSDIYVTYYYKKNTSVITKYVDIKTNDEIATQETQTGLQGDSYTTEQKQIDGYRYVSVDGNPEGEMAADTTTVTYYYIKQSTVTTKWVDKNTGKELTPSSSTIYDEDEPYTTEKKEFYGYEFVQDSGNTSGTVGREDITVIYTYDLIRIDIDITKTLGATDSTGVQNLSGARFKLTVDEFPELVALAEPDETYYSTYTDEDGHCIISGVPYGTYTIVEETVPDTAYAGQFYLDGEKTVITSFTIDVNENKNLTYSIEDVPKKINITIYKEDKETGTTTQGDAHLEGAQYTVYRDADCTDAVETLTIVKNDDGTYSATTGWYLVGTYYIKEDVKEEINGVKYSYAEGYLVDETVYTVSQDPASQTDKYKSFSITSKEEVIRNDIPITKYLAETETDAKITLEGAVFSATLNSNTEQVYYSSTTDENGYCIIEDLPYGTYTVSETTIPDSAYAGYFKVNDEGNRVQSVTVNITVDEDDTPLEYEYEDLTDVAKQMKIEINKHILLADGEATDATLQGAVFTLYTDEACTTPYLDKNGEVVTIGPTDENGYAISKYMRTGVYYMKETTFPEGIDPDSVVEGEEDVTYREKVYTVGATNSSQTDEYKTYTYDINNKVKRNDIVIYKNIEETSNTDQAPLDKCEFTATLISTIGTDHEYSVKCTAQTDENGYCIIEDLPYGKYIIEETTVSPISLKCANFYIFVEQDRKEKPEPYEPKDAYKWDDITLGEEEDTTKDYEAASYKWLDEEYNIVDVAKVMQIKIRKVDEYVSQYETATDHTYSQGDAVLEGAVYEIYRYDPDTDDYTEYVYDITVDHIDDEGYWCAESDDLLVGKYMVIEKVKSTEVGADGKTYKYSYGEGYLVDETAYYFEVQPDTQDYRVSYHSAISTEQVIRGRIDAIKYDDNSTSSDKSSATGAVLRLTLDSDPTVYYDATVDEYGYIEWVEEKSREKYYPYTIPYGKYTITEVQASDSGKNIFIDAQDTQISTSTQSNHYILEDEYVTLKLTIEIRDSETEKLVPGGARYKIWDVDNECWYSEMSYPSGEYITEFVTDDEGQLTINGNLEAGTYIIYEISAPYGYYLDDELREGNTGYEFTVAVEKDGDVVVYYNGQTEVLEHEEVVYQNIPVTMYYYTAPTYNTPQKGVISVEKLAEQFTSVTTSNSEYGTLNTPVWEEVGLEGVTFNLVAAEDIITPEGTVRYEKGQVVDTIVTDENGLASTIAVYLGEYTLEEVSTPNGYLATEDPRGVTIEYTHQYELIQYLEKETITNDTQVTSLSLKKVFEELTALKFKVSNKSAVFGIYTSEVIENYKGQNTIGKDELVDIMVMDDTLTVNSNVNLPEGKYYVKELSTSNPYMLSTDTYDFTVEYTNSTDKTIELTINGGQVTNTAKTVELEILIYPDEVYERLEIAEITDRDTLEELAKQYGIADKTYGVYEDEECTIPVMTTDDTEATFETNAYGIINIPDMPTGTYYFKELEPAPYGYDISDEVIEVVIDGNTDPVIITASEPLKMAKLLQKTDSYTKDIVAGVTYEITDEEENVVYTGQTDENGYLEIPIIYFENGATYYYQEIDAPENYELDEEKYEFVASYDEDTCEWTLDLIDVVNDRKTIDYVKVIKTDADTGERLEGCVFTIVLLDDNGNEYVNQYGETIYLVENATTDENGEYIIENVPYGTYKFVEMVAPEGYELDADMTGLTFTANDDTKDGIIFEVTNTGDIAIIAITGVLVLSIVGIVLRKKMLTN